MLYQKFHRMVRDVVLNKYSNSAEIEICKQEKLCKEKVSQNWFCRKRVESGRSPIEECRHYLYSDTLGAVVGAVDTQH